MIQKVERFEKQEAEKSVLMQLNYRHDMLFQKLSEANLRLSNVAHLLGGAYAQNEPRTFPQVNLDHLDVYSNLLDKTEVELEGIFNTLSRLEHLL
jgi:hypothetical protein